ncbi:MAG: Uncharacterized MFS-type transporter, partial [uncultured Solirubrobacteraceae bacterium]
DRPRARALRSHVRAGGPLALGGPRRALRRDAHDRPRRHRGERRAALHPGGPVLLAGRAGLGGQRLPHRLRRPAPARGPARGPGLPPRGVPRRPRGLHRGLPGLRARPQPGGPRGRALRAGRRRRDGVRGHPRDDRDHVPRAARAGPGDRGLRVRGLRGRVDRPAGRRGADPGRHLALDLLREPAHRRRHRGPGAPAPAARPGHGPGPGRGRRRRAPRHGRAHAARLHHRRARRRARLGREPDDRPRRRGPRPARGLRRPGGHGRPSARPPADLPLAERRGRERDPGPRRGRDVRDVLPRGALPPARAGLRRPADGRGLPAHHDHHGRALAQGLRRAHRALRGAGDAAARARPRARGPRALHAGARGRRVRRARAARDGPARRRGGPGLPRAHGARDVGSHAAGRGPGLRPGEHHRAGRRGGRPGRARHGRGLREREPPGRGRRRPRRAQRGLPRRLPRRGGACRGGDRRRPPRPGARARGGGRGRRSGPGRCRARAQRGV